MASKHTAEIAIDKCSIMTRVNIEIKRKVLRRFQKPGMSLSECAAAALTASVDGVELTAEDWDLIRTEMQSNFDKRMSNREKVKQFNANNAKRSAGDRTSVKSRGSKGK